MKDQPDGYSVRNIFEDSCTEEGTGSGKAIFEGGFKVEYYEERKKFDSTASAVLREEDRSTYPSTHKHKKIGR